MPANAPEDGDRSQAAGPVSDPAPDRTLDITGEICPMTFVHTRLALDRMTSGQTLLVLLRGAEPAANVPRTAIAQGHRVLSEQIDQAGVTHLLLRRR